MAGVPISADEVFEMAEEIERNGAAFYRQAAHGAVEERHRELLTTLADMEVQHERTFKAMRHEFAGPGAVRVDPDSEAALYLRAMVDGRVFDRSDPSRKLTGKEPMTDVLHTAIGLERDSIAFYSGISRMVGGESGKAKVNAIIKEEMSHVAILSEELAVVESGR